MKFPILLLLCCVGATVAEATSQWNSIYVTPSNGSNTPGCGNLTSPCKNLTYALRLSLRKNSTMYVLSPGTHYLDNTTYLHPFSLDGLGIRGNGGQSFVECVGPNAGLSFVGTSNVLLENVTFSHCAALQNSTNRNFSNPLNILRMYQFNVGLYFYLCKNVSMNRVEVTGSPNGTGVTMFDTTGVVNVTHSNFTNNRNQLAGGGGFFIEFTYCLPGDDNCSDGQESYTAANSGSNYSFQYCTFSSNANHNPLGAYYTWFVLPTDSVHNSFGRGGGLSIFLKGNATNNTIEVTNCTFENNIAMWGGAIGIHLLDRIAGNTVAVDSCTFSGNRIPFLRGSSGGGIDIVHCVLGNQGDNKVSVHGSHFFNNAASSGGALSILAARQNTTKSKRASVKIHHSCFEGNRAAGVGAAVFLSRYMVVLNGEMLKIEFSDSEFTSNSLASGSSQAYLEGVGAVYVDKVSVNFRNSINFSRNVGSALGVTGTHIDFSGCSVGFEYNSGYQGGAIALLGSAWILLDNTTSMYFLHNYAYTKGGALYNKYIQKEDMSVFPNCFLNHQPPFLTPDKWNNSFHFEDNDAKLHGKSIYSTSILPCTSGDSGDNGGTFCWNNWTYRRNGTNVNCSDEIGSDVGSIILTGTNLVEAFPGKDFALPLELRDDLNHSVTKNTVFIASTRSTTASIPDFTYVTHTSAKLLGQGSSSNVTLVLDTVSDRVWRANVIVKLQHCPPGFTSSSDGKKAVCICSGNFGRRLTCNHDYYTSRLRNAYWMGISPYDNRTLVIGLCHESLCFSNLSDTTFLLPNSTSRLDSHICGWAKRTGIMCGECLKGHAPAVNSDTFQCAPCNGTSIVTNSVFYLLSVYLPLFILFTVIILFNVRLTSGPAVAFLLYSQVISSIFYPNGDGHIPLNTAVKHSRILMDVYVKSYGVFNLEFIENFIEPFCLGKSMNNLDVLQLNYLVALFPLLMIIFVLSYVKIKALVSGRCLQGKLASRTWQVTNFTRKWRLGDSLLHAFAAFILLSYTKFSLTSSYIVCYQRLFDENNSEVAGAPRLLLAGQYATRDPEYQLNYLLPAVIVFATFVAVPPLLLLHYPVHLLELCINRVHCLRRLYPVDKVHILLDTFQGCYKNNMRFFAGLYFIFRIILQVSYILTPTIYMQFTIQQVTCIIFAVLVALCQPYTRKFLNYVDSLIFTNLAIINSLSMHLWMYAERNPGGHLPLTPFVIQYILILLPGLYMILYVIWYVTTPHHEKVKTTIRKWLKLRHKDEKDERDREQQTTRKPLHLGHVLRSDISTTEVVDVDREISEAPDDDMEALLKRAERENLYRAPGQTLEDNKIQEEEDDQSGLLHDHRQKNQYGSTQ